MTTLRKKYEASGGDRETRISLATMINNRTASQPASTSEAIKQKRASFRSLLTLFGDLPAPDTLDRREADLVSRGHGNLAWFDILEKQYDAAIQKCGTALKYSPQSSWIRSNLALANLASLGDNGLRDASTGPVLLQSGDGFDASRLLLLLQEEGLLVAIPERDTLWIGPEEGQNLEQLMAVTEQISDRSQYPVSPSLFRVKDGRLQPVQESN